MGRLPKAVREEKAEKALALSCKGKTYTAIAKELEVTRNTVGTLIDHALSHREIDEDDEREKSLAHHKEIIRWCWEQLETEELGKNAQNRPAYINRIQHSQGEIDRLNNVAPPLRMEQNVNVSYRDYTTGSELKELFEEIDSWLAQSDSEANSEVPLDTA